MDPQFDFDQGSEEWLAARAGKLSASRFPGLMTTLKSGKPAQSYTNVVWDAAIERLTGRKMETFQSGAMARGIELEPLAREAYEDHYLVSVDEVPFVVHQDYEFISCSPDGLVGDDGLAEFKCLTAANHGLALLTGKHAKDYYWQAMGQMWVTGRAWCDVVAFHPEYPPELQLAIVHLERDEEAIERLEATCILANQDIEDILAQLHEIAA